MSQPTPCLSAEFGGKVSVLFSAKIDLTPFYPMISLGQKMGCDMTKELALAAALTVPGRPIGAP